ncbi:MAG: response regulator transcription factor [Anaerolineae bacterium]|nr:response regulator transcription factor [Anaerolineae bacterium]
MAVPQRILAADGTTRVATIVRSAIDLIERPAVVIAVPDGESALAELERGGIDVLVSAYHLPDMRGEELTRKAQRRASGMRLIILAGLEDPDPDEDTRQQSGVEYVVRAQSGERFVALLRAALDGEKLPDPGAQIIPALPDLGPVPPVPLDALGDILSIMLTDVGAMAVVLADRQGNILQELGAVGYLDREQLTGTLAPNFANMVSVGPLVGGKRPSAMHFYDGDEFDIFALAIGLHYFVCLIFEGSAGSRAFGAVTMFGRRAVQEMLEAIGASAFEVQQAAAPAPVAPARKRPAAAPPPEPPPAPAEPAAVAPRPPQLEPLPDDTDLESLLGGLGKLDLSQADDLFDPDKLAEIAAETMAGDRLSFDEAQQMGVLQQQEQQ